MNRPVQILTLAFRDEPLEKVLLVAENELKPDTDILLLPEMWLGDAFPVQCEDSIVLKKISELAKTNSCYVICPLAFSPEGASDVRYNSALVLNREGDCIYRYDKVFPWWDEFNFNPPCIVGETAGCFKTDFGVCGIAICFDVNFPELWKKMDELGAEIVFWPSDYSAGKALQAHAINHHYYIVSATRERDSALIDICGDEIAYNKTNEITVSHFTIDLDRSIFHENYNMGKMYSLINNNIGICLERRFLREQWFILTGKSDVSVKEESEKKGMELLRDYLHRSKREINPNF